MADGLYNCVECPENCGDTELGKFVTSECVDAIEDCESEICTMLYVEADPDDPTKPLFAPTDWTNEADWQALIDNGDICCVNVIGDQPEPEQESRVISKRRTKLGKKSFVNNLTIDEWTPENYEAMRKWECGGDFFYWPQTIDGAIYGGPTGIKVSIKKADAPLTRGENQYKTILLQVGWEKNCHPPVTTAVPPLVKSAA